MPDFKRDALTAFSTFIEKALGAELLVPSLDHPGIDRDIADLYALAETFKAHGICEGLYESHYFPDEPRYKNWYATDSTKSSGGMSLDSDRSAMIAALAESLERSIWYHDTDYFTDLKHGTFSQVASAVDPHFFASFSSEQRTSDQKLSLEHGTWTWIQGYSWVRNGQVHLPAQTISRRHAADTKASEPRIRPTVTTGLATGESRIQALLGGMLECIERDAYMLMWLNQLALPRISHDSFSSDRVQTLLARCKRYGIDVHFVRLLSDAPTYAIAAVTRDETHLPGFALGMCAHQDHNRAAEKSLLEALRARANTRRRMHTHSSVRDKEPHLITGWEREVFWSHPERLKHLDFITRGTQELLARGEWHMESDEAHHQRLIAWCRAAGIECISVSMTRAQRNITPWHIEFVVMPELLWMHLDERQQCHGSDRRMRLPKAFGYTPRPQAFSDLPHPFV